MRLALDTNVLVSAYGFGGKPADLVRLVLEGRVELVTSTPLLAEFARVLHDVLDFDDEHVEAVIRQIARVGEIVEPRQRLQVAVDDSDNRLLECAAEGRADLIVSGDRHLLELGEFQGIDILKTADALARL